MHANELTQGFGYFAFVMKPSIGGGNLGLKISLKSIYQWNLYTSYPKSGRKTQTSPIFF